MGISKRKSNSQGDVPQRIWDRVLKGLPELEAEVARLRFGIGGGSPQSVSKVAKTLKIGRERVHRIEVKALKRLEKILPQRRR